MSFETGMVTKRYEGEYISKSSSMTMNNYEIQLRQKDTEIKNLRYELEIV
jgi:hypothetical protein